MSIDTAIAAAALNPNLKAPTVVRRGIEYEPHVVENGTAAEHAMAMEISRVLTRHYPGHAWAVFVNGKGGIAYVMNFQITAKMGFVLHLSNLDSPNELAARAIRAGGEYLERHRIDRGRADRDQMLGMSKTADFRT
jgi:hypothetical protein